MGVIIPLPRRDNSFNPNDIQAMSKALEDVCTALKISADATGRREGIAKRIVELARCGERTRARLRDGILEDAPAFLEPVHRP
jgi:hypothetical protein